MNKKRLFMILGVCCILAAAFILGATGVIDLNKKTESKQSDKLIGIIVTTEFPSSTDFDYVPGQGVVLKPIQGVLADRKNDSSRGSMPAEIDYVFPGVEGMRLFNIDTPPFSDGHTQVDTSAADEEFCHVSTGTRRNNSKHNGSEESTETIYEISGTLKHVIPEDEITFYTTPIYRTVEGEVYLGYCSGAHTMHKEYWNNSTPSFTESSSSYETRDGVTVTEGRSITVNIQLVRQPVRITLCQFNTAHELIHSEQYLPGDIPRKITLFRETATILVDTENIPDDGHECHTYESYSRDDSSFYTLEYMDNGYCRENYHELKWPDPDEAADLSWNVDGITLTISGHGKMPDYERNAPTVDADGFTVMGSVATPWKKQYFTRVIIEEGITSLGELAFEGNQDMTSVTLPETLTSIAHSAFQYCEGLTRINIPGSISKIDFNTFSGCRKLEKIILPDSVTQIGSYAFSYCTLLTDVILPDSLISVGANAFAHCLSLEYISLPASVRQIGKDAFAGCGNLKSITVSEGSFAEQYCKENKLPYDYGDGTPVHRPEPANPGVTWKVEDDTLFISGKGPMDDYCPRAYPHKGDNRQIDYGTSAPWDEETFSKVVIGEGITSIGELTFSNRKGLYSVTLPKSLTTIGKSTFFDCRDLEEINLDSVTAYGETAFCGCKNLKSISLSPSLETIESSSFHACTSLTEIRVPDSVKIVKPWAFFNCFSLEKVYLPASVTEIGSRAFYGCKNLKEIVVEKGSYAEQYCIDNNLPCTYSN